MGTGVCLATVDERPCASWAGHELASSQAKRQKTADLLEMFRIGGLHTGQFVSVPN